MTPVVVQTVGKVTTQVRIFNPFAEPVLLGGEEALGSLTPVKIERVLQNEEHPQEKGNEQCCRQVVIKQPAWSKHRRQIHNAK